MGAFYRSRHELIFAFKNGARPHLNSFELGQHGRYRTNIWEYRGANTLKAGRQEELALHPTVKPVAMIADAMKDVSRRGGVVLDLFGGSGSTLIAAHKTGRRARVCELDPIYCDRILRRWEIFRQGRRRTDRLRSRPRGREGRWRMKTRRAHAVSPIRKRAHRPFPRTPLVPEARSTPARLLIKRPAPSSQSIRGRS